MNILITGVSSGIGHALASHYLQQGHNVYGISRRVPNDLKAYNSFKHSVLDLTNFEAAASVLSQLLSDVVQLDLVVLNAGILGPIGDMKNQSVGDLQHVMNVNVWANKPVVDEVLRNVNVVTTIIAISSGAAVNGNRGWAGYSISKAALNMFVKLYAAENEQTNFYAFAPGLVDTAMQDVLCSDEMDKPTFPASAKLKMARNTTQMPTPEVAAKNFATVFETINKYPNGSFIDVRSI